MSKRVWLATNGERIWPMEHEGDYDDDCTLVCVEVAHPGEVTVRVVRGDLGS